MRTRVLALVGAGALVWAALASPAQSAENAQLSVLHAVPGLTVDVYVNGERTLNNFKPGNLAGPLNLGRRDLRGRHHRRRCRRRLRSRDRPDRSQVEGRRELHRRGPSEGERRSHRDPVHQRHLQDRCRSGPAHRPAHRGCAGGRHPGGWRRGDQRPEQPGREGSRPRCRHGRGGRGRRRHHRPGDRPGRRDRGRRQEHHRVRLGQPGRRQPEAGDPDHLRSAFPAAWDQRRAGRSGRRPQLGRRRVRGAAAGRGGCSGRPLHCGCATAERR